MKIHDPAMTFAEGGRELWERAVSNNRDGYGDAIMRFASEWATRMEARERLKSAVTAEQVQCAINAIAQEEYNSADDEGITGFMYGAAVATLAKTWVYGEALRRWHNKETQIGTEGDRANEKGTVLNPAVINIGGKS